MTVCSEEGVSFKLSAVISNVGVTVVGYSMIWQCKLCSASFTDRLQVFKHYRLQHSHFSSVSPLPCIYNDCMSTFKTLNSLRTHLSRYHTRQFGSSAEHSQQALLFKCPLCPFQQQFSESVLFCHLRRHLRNHETVACPYKDCSFTTNVYSSFNSHKSRSHQASVSSDFQNDIVSEVGQASIPAVDGDLFEEPPGTDEDPVGDDGQCDTDELKKHLRMNLSSLFLKMQAILHVSNTATQEIVEHLNQVCFLSQPLIKEAIKDILQRNGCNVAESALDEAVYAEFLRITNQNLPNTFYSELDRHLPRLMTLFRQKAGRTGKTSDALTEILKLHDEQEFHDIHTKRVTVLHALPVYLREDVSEFFKTCTDTSDEPELLDVAVALLTVVKDNDTSPVHFQPVKICCH